MSTTLPVSRVVNVTIEVAPAFPQMPGFGLLCIMGASPNLPTSQRYREYGSLDEVAADFGGSSPEYLAAEIFFSQSPTPDQLAIARRFPSATNGELMCGLNSDQVVADWKLVTNGSLDITVDGSAVGLTGLDFHLQTDLSGVASVIQTALRVVATGAHVTWTGEQFIIQSGTTGVDSSVGWSTTPTGGTDIGPLLAARAGAPDFATATQGVAAETITESLENIRLFNQDWFFLTLTSECTDQDIQDTALWAEAEQLMFGFTTLDSNVLDGGQSDDIVSTLKGRGYAFTIGQYDPADPYAIVSAIARAVTVDFEQPNSTITLMFKLEPGISPLKVSSGQADVLESKNCNYYTYFGGSAMLCPGKQVGGRWFDEVFGLAWLKARVQNAVFGYLYTTVTKVPQTDKGVQRIVQQIEVAMHQAVVNGLLAPGLWEGPPLTDPVSGATIIDNMEQLARGYFVYAAPVASQSQQQRSARIAPPITILAKGAGAIQHVNIVINFEQ